MIAMAAGMAAVITILLYKKQYVKTSWFKTDIIIEGKKVKNI